MGYRKFKPEFKRRVVQEWLSGEKSVAQICRQYELADSLVRRWREEYQQRGPDAWESAVRRDGELETAQRLVNGTSKLFTRCKAQSAAKPPRRFACFPAIPDKLGTVATNEQDNVGKSRTRELVGLRHRLPRRPEEPRVSTQGRVVAGAFSRGFAFPAVPR